MSCIAMMVPHMRSRLVWTHRNSWPWYGPRQWEFFYLLFFGFPNRAQTCPVHFSQPGQRYQGESSSTPVTSDLSKTFHQICLWLHQLVITKKSTEDSVIYLLGNPQRDVCDWLTLINKLDTITTYSIPTATCQQQQTTPNHACPCVCACWPEVPPYRTKKEKIKKFFISPLFPFFFIFLFFILRLKLKN